MSGDIDVATGVIERTWKDRPADPSRFTDTWAFRGGRWRLLARQLAR